MKLKKGKKNKIKTIKVKLIPEDLKKSRLSRKITII
jgi:hypothetical protein